MTEITIQPWMVEIAWAIIGAKEEGLEVSDQAAEVARQILRAVEEQEGPDAER